MAIELNVYCDIMPGKLPRVEVKPVIWYFNLEPIDKLLLEDTIFVAQAITPRRVIHSGHGIEKACCETSEATIAKGSVVLLRYDIFDSESQILESVFCNVFETDIEHSVVQSSAHQELEGKVVDTFLVCEGLSLLGLVPFDDEAVSKGQGGT
jgi:hypothetical protein